MSAPDLDLELTLRTVDAVIHRVRSGQVSYAAGDALDAAAAELRALIDGARGGAGAERSLWEAATRELDDFLAEIYEDLAYLATVQSGDDPRAALCTRVGWGGRTVTALAADVPAETRAAHGRAVLAETRRRLVRLHLLSALLAAAARVAVLISAPGGALLALPAAWRLLRSIHETVSTMTEQKLQGA